MRVLLISALLGSTLIAAGDAAAQGHGGSQHRQHRECKEGKTQQHGSAQGCSHADSAFAALQERGKTAMGVDQYASTHTFDALADGGRILYVMNDAGDAEGVAQVRAHLREIARAFREGDFTTPAFVHIRQVPGTATMAAKKAVIAYAFREVPQGAELRITTADPEAIRAIHEFMAFQRKDHRAGGRTGHD